MFKEFNFHFSFVYQPMSHSSVKLYVYDLSNGLARQFSGMMLNKQIDAIFHTSVVVYGIEYFFGQGICQCQPGQSHHGNPIQVLDYGKFNILILKFIYLILILGYTEIPQEVFEEHLAELSEGSYGNTQYHLLNNNCNHFTNDLCMFLVGKEIPSNIKSLPSEFLQTPLGQQLRPMIDAMFSREPHFQPAANPLHSSEEFDFIWFSKGDIQVFCNKLTEFIQSDEVKIEEGDAWIRNEINRISTEKDLRAESYRCFNILVRQNLLPDKIFPIFDLIRLSLVKSVENFHHLIALNAEATETVDIFSWMSTVFDSKDTKGKITALKFLTVLAASCSMSNSIFNFVKTPQTLANIVDILVQSLNESKQNGYDVRCTEPLSSCLHNLVLLSSKLNLLNEEKTLDITCAALDLFAAVDPFEGSVELSWTIKQWQPKSYSSLIQSINRLFRASSRDTYSEVIQLYKAQIKGTWAKVFPKYDKLSPDVRVCAEWMQLFLRSHC